jgi:hypothetical protein
MDMHTHTWENLSRSTSSGPDKADANKQESQSDVNGQHCSQKDATQSGNHEGENAVAQDTNALKEGAIDGCCRSTVYENETSFVWTTL